eukprot:9964740-Heterocapsa_arctica.AAC.1
MEEGGVGIGMGSRVDFAADRKPAGSTPRHHELFEGSVQNELHAWVPQAALGSGVFDDSEVVADHFGSYGDRI